VTNLPAQTTSTVVGIILAAGRSRRMGAFKPLLPFGDSTVIDSCISNLREGGVEEVIVVIGHRGEVLRKHLAGSKITLIDNPDPEGEMSSSIAYGVQAVAPGEGAFILTPADYPAIPSAVISQLLSEWRNGSLLIKPTWQDRGGHPVLVDMSFRSALLNLDSERGLKGFFEDHMDQVRRLPVGSNYIARDLDTWDDYAALHQEVFGVPAPDRFDQ
jgi:molybdenum cofactor cytidylyltransferase